MRMSAAQYAAAQKRAQAGAPPTKPYGRGTPKRPGDMNKTEQAYADHLEARRLAGEILWWAYEPWKFRLADRTFITPDFGVMLQDGTLEIHETKGHMRDDAAVKLKVGAEQHWMFRWRLVKKVNGGWDIREIWR